VSWAADTLGPTNRDVSRQRINLPAQQTSDCKGVGPFLQVAEYNMSQSPRTTDVEGQQVPNSAALQADANQPSPDEHEQQEMSRGPDDPGDHGMGVYDFEVKEQDRWLPIANGMSFSVLPSLLGRTGCDRQGKLLSLYHLCTTTRVLTNAINGTALHIPHIQPNRAFRHFDRRIRAASASPDLQLWFLTARGLPKSHVFCIPSTVSITATASPKH
jgi:hypothetical protein